MIRTARRLFLMSFAILAVGCGLASRDSDEFEKLVGDWASDDGRMVMRINADGTYAIDGAGRLESNPADVGVIVFDEEAATLILTSGEESNFCGAGDVWIWDFEQISEEQFRGIVTLDDCTNSIGRYLTWTSCEVEPLGENLVQCLVSE